jgi:hypothetical protein
MLASLHDGVSDNSIEKNLAQKWWRKWEISKHSSLRFVFVFVSGEVLQWEVVCSNLEITP